jgi:hypothetical protein
MLEESKVLRARSINCYFADGSCQVGVEPMVVKEVGRVGPVRRAVAVDRPKSLGPYTIITMALKVISWVRNNLDINLIH